LSEGNARPPLLLFDGVCNLCHGAVQWILARDRKQVFRFASLQSRVGREALAEAGFTGPTPESVVVIEDGQVYLAGNAALRVASILGGVWSAAAVFRIIPRPIRDGIYHWIARNRYRWFGKKEACPMPTPGTLERFLDAHEPPPESWEIAPEQSGTAGASHPAASFDEARGKLASLASWGARLGFVYWLLYMFPFPATLIPWVNELADDWVALHQSVLAWFGDVVFSRELSFPQTGSGDTTAAYIEIVMRLAIATIAATIWHYAVRRRAISARTIEWLYLGFRFYLVSILMVYGWIKLFPAQMPPPGPDRLLQPIGDTSPMGLAWTFIGSSPAYQMFSGAAELTAGFLLLFRRTALLGALVSFGVMLNVAALNFFYDVPVKLFSTHLVVLSALLILPDVARLGALFIFQLPTQPRVLRPYPWKRRWQRVAATAFLFGFLYQTVWPAIQSGWNVSHTYGVLAKPGPMHGLYTVEVFEWGDASDREIEDDRRWVRLGINHRWGEGNYVTFAVVLANGTTSRGSANFHKGVVVSPSSEGVPLEDLLDSLTATVSGRFHQLSLHSPISGIDKLAVERGENGALVLWARVEEQVVRIQLKREPADSFELTRRGFHWINEFPRNR
jgi:predicted DCC family thiol-disulfide oxidoreductase YuxK